MHLIGLLIMFTLASAYSKGGLKLALSYAALLVSLTIVALCLKVAIAIWRADWSLWERNRSVIRAIRRFNRDARRGIPSNIGLKDLETNGLVQVNCVYSVKLRAFIPQARIAESALLAPFRMGT